MRSLLLSFSLHTLTKEITKITVIAIPPCLHLVDKAGRPFLLLY